ncbi:F-box/WD repeat-containing protein 7 [Striga asiatica]|uniref:F-box/WD repeat-containing protein 7 n=1 Tax=Striga asiatica TaxID=4170 RepID=A0A5A7NXX1_STRAF|nr:F-box/WD repeat-containing protein 7 [Striga asiatica]
MEGFFPGRPSLSAHRRNTAVAGLPSPSRRVAAVSRIIASSLSADANPFVFFRHRTASVLLLAASFVSRLDASSPSASTITWIIAWQHSLVLIIENANVMATNWVILNLAIFLCIREVNGIGVELRELGCWQCDRIAVEADKKSPTTQRRTLHIQMSEPRTESPRGDPARPLPDTPSPLSSVTYFTNGL